MTRHLIGLQVGIRNRVLWATFREMLRRVGPVAGVGGSRHYIDCEPVATGPFGIRDIFRYELIIDRVGHRYHYPLERLKKAALMNGVYLLNNPFTLQSMEKHATYCAMARLGLKVPETALVPFKDPARDARQASGASPYRRAFDLDAVAQQIGYPLFMKPYDGMGGGASPGSAAQPSCMLPMTRVVRCSCCCRKPLTAMTH